MSINTAIINYQDFQILVDNNTIRASSEQGEVSEVFSLNKNEIKLALKLIESEQTDKELLKALGNTLYHALFPNQINARFHATLAGAASNNQSVRLRLIFQSPEIAALPWEFLYDEGTNSFLANNTQTVLSRYIDVPLLKRELIGASLPLKVLLVIASPSNLPKLDTTGEEQLIKEALQKHIEAGQIELDVLHLATSSNIRQKLREKPYNVFHFIGHGEFKSNQGYIALVDENGKAKPLDDENFSNFFLGNNSLGLVILNSCKGATISDHQAFAGTAPTLVRRGIPAVIAMQYTIYDNTAKIFADEFYRTLALGYPIDAAIQTTRNAISIEVGLETRDFATPVLYMRAKDGIILNGLVQSNPNQPPDEFKPLIEEKLKSFCGREFVFAKFQEFQQNHSKGYFTVVGDAGMGKSTIAAKYVSQHNCPCYFNILAERRNRPEDFLKSIRQQLIQRYALQNVDDTNLLGLLVKAREKQNKLVIIVDALDEVEQPNGAENILYLPEHLPEGVYFFLTRRPYAEGQKGLRTSVIEEELDLRAESYQNLNLEDIKTRISSFIKDPEYQRDLHKWITDRNINQDTFITEVAAKSENNFMYLRYVLPEIARGYYKDLSLDKLPDGLQNYYEQHWKRMGMEKSTQEIKVIILYIIVEWNTPPISLSDIAAIANTDEYEVEEVLEEWCEYLRVQTINEDGEEDKCYRVYHASFLDFLKSRRKLDKKRKLFEEVNQRIASYVYG